MKALFETRKVQGTRRKVSAIKLDKKYMQYNADNKFVTIWSGDDDRFYEAKTVNGAKYFVPFKMAA